VDGETWLARRSSIGADVDPERLVAAKREQSLRVSVCLPTLNVEDTVGAILATVRDHWVAAGLVDELVVVDSRSDDRSVAVARAEGATVYQDVDVLPETGQASGKGEALWKSLHVSHGDLVLWLDSDVVGFDPAFVPGMLAPLLTDPDVGYVKALYRRRLHDTDEGGRVTEICARPLLNLFYPELAVLAQPLSGEAAGRRDLLERMPFFTGYAVEIGLLIDICRASGVGAIAQVDLGERRHTNQPTAALGRMAYAITQAVLRRVAAEGRIPAEAAQAGPYLRPERTGGGWTLRETEVTVAERPPMISVPAYRTRHGVPVP
jgi:glucosyl-3-phosphoglycerate synthase